LDELAFLARAAGLVESLDPRTAELMRPDQMRLRELGPSSSPLEHPVQI